MVEAKQAIKISQDYKFSGDEICNRSLNEATVTTKSQIWMAIMAFTK